jgi:hypothetical protein
MLVEVVAVPAWEAQGLHILVTCDTLTGIWTYTRELVTGLITSGVRVTLVSFGEIPLPHQTAWMESLHGLDYRPTAFRLEWMQEGESDTPDSARYLQSLVRELKPDLLHLNQSRYRAWWSRMVIWSAGGWRCMAVSQQTRDGCAGTATWFRAPSLGRK